MIRVARLCIDSILLMCLLFAITKLRARLVQCCVKLHYGIVLGTQSLLLFSVVSNCTMGLFWERYHFFYSVLCQTALWDCFGNAIASFIGCYKVARETGSVLCQTALRDCFRNAITSSIGYY